jgi:hypothetical protein
VKSLALGVGALLASAGVLIVLSPATVLAVARHPITPLQLYASGLVRIAIGLLFIAAARGARIPWVLQLLGAVSLLAGLATFFLGVERAQRIAGWVAQQGLDVVRFFGVVPLVLGLLVVYGCGSVRRAV